MKNVSIDGISTVKQQLRVGRREKRDNRQAKNMSPLQHIWYALFWQLFVPNNGTVAWVLLACTLTFFLVHGLRK